MKRILQFILVFLFTVHGFSQTYTPPAFADIDTNYRHYVNNVFGALEANRVSTGLLMDYGFDFTDLNIYNGSILVDSTLMEHGIYSDLYKTIFTSRFNSNAGTLRHPNIHDSLCYIARQKEVITLSGLLFKYNAIDPNAQTNGKMQTVNGQLKDVYVNGAWQNPYQEFKTVAISPSIIQYNLTYCSVVLPSSLFLSNMSGDVSSIQFDADDGQGYRTLQYDVPLNLNYTDTGWKHWVFRVNLTGGQQLYSHSKLHFDSVSNTAGSQGIAARGVIDRRATVTATEAFDGVFGVADIVISYRNQNDQVLRRPLIIAEGLDAGHITSPEEPEGENTFRGFINSVIRSNSIALQNLISGNPFILNSPSEYDIVYINWRNGTDWLERNALVLEAVIRWVNNNKQPLNGVMQPNVVLGSSMGGVVARMALGRMDRNGGFNDHETSLNISLDAPQQGANVPLGYQAAARHGARIYLSTGPIAGIVEIIQLIRNRQSPLFTLFLADQPAPRQLLINRIDFLYNQVNATHNQFMEDLRTVWDYPANIRNIAISNGSECAIGQEFTAGSTLLYHHRSTKTRFLGDLIFMAAGLGLNALNFPRVITIPLMIPGSNKFELTLDIKSLAHGGGNQVYYGNIKLTKKVLWIVPVSINVANKTYYAPSGLLPFDTYPGGFYTVTLDNQPGGVSRDWMFSYDNSFFIQRRFCFIPTTSSLDIGEGNTTLTNTDYLQQYIGEAPPVAPLNSPFDNFITAFNANPIIISATGPTGQIAWQFSSTGAEPHEGFYIRNSNWLAQEINRTNPTDPVPQANCSAFCGLVITGPDAICDNGSFSVPDIPGATYTWGVSNPFLANVIPNNNTVDITRNQQGSGSITLSVQINSGGACGIITVVKTFQFGASETLIIGPYDITQHTVMGVAYVNTQYYFTPFETSSHFPSTNYTWTLFPPTGNPTLYAGSQPYITFDEIGYNTLQVAKTTQCGVILSSVIVNVQEDIGFRVMTAPNPVKDGVLNVVIEAEDGQLQVLSKEGEMIVELFNFNSAMKCKQWKLKNDQHRFQLNIRGIAKGKYIIRVKRGKYQRSSHIIIE